MKNKTKKMEKFIKCIPNRYPYNELLLRGKLSAKTRSWHWKHTGLTLLYTSKKMDSAVVDYHNLPLKFKSGIIVGYGFLKPVRRNTVPEIVQIEREFDGGFGWIEALPFRFEFENLTRLKTPIPFKPKSGAISVFNVPVEMLKGKIKKELLEL